jgi:hypothetical protein
VGSYLSRIAVATVKVLSASVSSIINPSVAAYVSSKARLSQDAHFSTCSLLISRSIQLTGGIFAV